MGVVGLGLGLWLGWGWGRFGVGLGLERKLGSQIAFQSRRSAGWVVGWVGDEK